MRCELVFSLSHMIPLFSASIIALHVNPTAFLMIEITGWIRRIEVMVSGTKLLYCISLKIENRGNGCPYLLELQLQWYALRIYRRHLFLWITGDDGALLRVSGVLENFACSPEYPECLYSSECVFIWLHLLLNKSIINQYSQFYAAHLLHYEVYFHQ